MLVCLAQFDPLIGALCFNKEKIIAILKKAKRDGADLIVFPELALTGYSPQDFLFQEDFIDQCEKVVEELLPYTKDLCVLMGYPRKKKGKLYNSAAVLIDGKVEGFQDKMLLPSYDVFDEKRYFQPGIKQQIFSFKGKKFGITICEDIWPKIQSEELYKEKPLDFFEREEIDFLVNMAASPYSLGKIEVRKELLYHVAITLQKPVLFCNQVGGQTSLLFDGSSSIFNADGSLLYQKPCFVEDFLTVDTDSLERSSLIEQPKSAELFFALVMGVKDFFSKQGFSKAVIGLSGGVDSSLVLCIAAVAMGKENVTGLLLPSRYTSSESTEDALYVANSLGVDTVEISIDPYFDQYRKLFKTAFEKTESLVEENIQSRIRANILMAFANQHQALLLNTGNKSESALGYTTLYGDSAGALSVIGDLVKTEVFALSKWISEEMSWISQRIVHKEPSAELREGQKDSDTIGDYHFLDRVLYLYLIEKRSARHIAEALSSSEEEISALLKKVEKAEFKRRQMPPLLRVSEKAFTEGRRLPLVHQFSLA